MIPLSVLDVFPVSTNTLPSAAIHDAVALACRADALGYHRYWVAEHHNMPNIASSAPEVMIGHVAGKTSRIRVGSGGIMLPNHAPLRVLEIFRTLEALYPGRIDLGIGRAPGTDPVTSRALRRAPGGGREVNQLIAEFFAFADQNFPEDHPFRGVDAMPTDVGVPPVWMLGSTSAGASIAAELGLGFAFAGHFSMGEAKEAVRTYRASFRPSPSMPASKLIMAVSVVCAETDERAEELALPIRVAIARMASGRAGRLPSVEEAKAYPFAPEELAFIERFAEGAVVGGPRKVKAGLENLVATSGADELMLSTIVPIAEERVRSFELVAKLWGLA
jgi:luciferase family oxidoreductase group 1